MLKRGEKIIKYVNALLPFPLRNIIINVKTEGVNILKQQLYE